MADYGSSGRGSGEPNKPYWDTKAGPPQRNWLDRVGGWVGVVFVSVGVAVALYFIWKTLP